MPPSFPTIQFLSWQVLYHLQPNLFSKILKAKNIQELKSLFQRIKTSKDFGKIITLSKSFQKKNREKIV
jgi:hypothetical protein